MAKWDKMTEEQRRKAIAQDVIKQINLGRMNIISNTYYLDGDLPKNCIEKSKSTRISKSMARDIQKTCNMCARGALAIAKIAKFDAETIKSLGLYDIDYISLNAQDTSKILKEAFSIEELHTIERVFEGTECEFHKFHDDHIDDGDRLIAICQNIIDNGSFDPSVRYDIVEV